MRRRWNRSARTATIKRPVSDRLERPGRSPPEERLRPLRGAMIMRVAIAAALLTISAASYAAEPEASTWKAGVATVVITPDGPMWMAGYAARDKPAEGKLHDLKAKAL